MLQSRVGENSSSLNHYNSADNSGSFNNTNSFNNTDSFNNINSFNNTISVSIRSADETAEILAWLSPLEPRIRHHNIRAHRVEHVGDWLLQTEEYRNWFDGSHGEEPDSSVLFCYGDPGVGKTHIR